MGTPICVHHHHHPSPSSIMASTQNAPRQMQMLLLAIATFAIAPVAPFTAAVPRTTSRSSTSLAGGGMGMGVAAATKKNGKKNKKNKKNKRGASPVAAASTAPFDVAKSALKSEKLYDEIMTSAAKALLSDVDDPEEVTSEYMIVARGAPDASPSSPSSSGGAADWIPVAQLCLVRRLALDDGEDVLTTQLCAAVSRYRREIHFTACQAAPSAFGALPRDRVEYGAEPLESFHRHVYEDVIEGKRGGEDANGEARGMTKAAAREVLELEAGCADVGLIKTAFKRQAARHHPDRAAEEDKAAASERFARIRNAYNTLNSGVRHNGANGDARHSWFASLGGRDRTDFVGPLTLLSAKEVDALRSPSCKSAMIGIDPDLTMTFVARNQAAGLSD